MMHKGATKLRQLERISVYWPGIEAKIVNEARKEYTLAVTPSGTSLPTRASYPPIQTISLQLGRIQWSTFPVPN